MGKNGQKLPKWAKMAKNGQTWPKNDQKMAKNGQKCSIIAKNDIKRSKMIKNGQKCKKKSKNGLKW